MKGKRGFLRLHSDEVLNKKYVLKISEREHNLLSKFSIEMGKPMSEIIRDGIAQQMKSKGINFATDGKKRDPNQIRIEL